ncbi:thioesterase superfamily protein [Streptomyces sp. 1114.5]|uniref:thioesterase family protein n=1 Tax=unclassified Streptomyces TaxID=2593676 RepID=UPI000BDC5567|nr:MULTISPECIES: thioesterase family protein [unclassified Streptomyces]RKT20065.1 thioesterase superfamily protein [Streptomyces sp. 1114.5]SOB86253.1 Thioesterase-like superfamily protein [Streptomyces sp. 1331.2]
MTTPTTAPESYYQRTGEHSYKPTPHAQGAWHPDEQHFSPLAGLIVHAIDCHRADGHRADSQGADRRQTGDSLALARISFDILGLIALEEFEITVETVRPGRTIELVEATVVIGERAVVRARAWFLAELDTAAVAGTHDEPIPAPEEFEPWAMSELWGGGYIASIDVRRRERAPGRAAAWISTPVGLVAGEPSSPQASFVALVDTANGIAVRQSPTAWMFPNTDLTIHLFRRPEGRWTGLDTRVSFGPAGHGVTSTVLHDEHGPIGRAEQILTVRPQPVG